MTPAPNQPQFVSDTLRIRTGLVPADPRDEDEFRLLNVLAHSPLADVPRPFISLAQIRAVLAGQVVQPTDSQKLMTMRIVCETSAAEDPREVVRKPHQFPRMPRTNGVRMSR